MGNDDRWRNRDRDDERWDGGRDHRGRNREDVLRAYGEPRRNDYGVQEGRYGPTETGFGETAGRDENRRFGSGDPRSGSPRGRGFDPDYGGGRYAERGYRGEEHERAGGDYGMGGDYVSGSSADRPSYSNEARDYGAGGRDGGRGERGRHTNPTYGGERGGWGRASYDGGGSLYGGPEYGRGYRYDVDQPSRRGRDEAGSRDWGRENARPGSQPPGERGFWDRAVDEVSSWFGDEEAERRRRGDEMRDEHRGRGPRGYRRSDERIREDVCDRLTEHPWVDASDVEVSVSGSEVTLAGTVTSRDQRRRAEDITEQVAGVTHVQNNLRVAGREGSASRASVGEITGSGLGVGATAPRSAASGTTGAGSVAGGAARSVTAGSFTPPSEPVREEPTGPYSEAAADTLTQGRAAEAGTRSGTTGTAFGTGRPGSGGTTGLGSSSTASGGSAGSSSSVTTGSTSSGGGTGYNSSGTATGRTVT